MDPRGPEWEWVGEMEGAAAPCSLSGLCQGPAAAACTGREDKALTELKKDFDGPGKSNLPERGRRKAGLVSCFPSNTRCMGILHRSPVSSEFPSARTRGEGYSRR